MSELEKLSPIVEALIFAAGAPVAPAQLRRAVPELSAAQTALIVKEVNRSLAREGRPYEIAEVAGGYQFRTRPEFADVVRAMQPERKVRLSRAALETLAVIAYRQPITRPEIEDLRCVDCGAVLKGLLERGFVRIVGRREAAGRPVLYGTSARFLETFGLPSLRDLPELRELDTMWEERGTPVEEALTARQPQSKAQEDALAGATPLESMEPETRDPQEPEDAPPY